MGKELSEGLRRFIKQYITSLEQLEILLLLYEEPDRPWTIEEVYKVTQTNHASVAERLKTLAASGLVIAEGTDHPIFRFRPGPTELTRRISELQKAYTLSKYKVVEAIFSAPRDQAQKFADSFKIRRKE
jgi:predicted transcriptional regulator